MADNSANTFPVAAGEIYRAATSTGAPTSAISSLSSWTAGLLGFLSPAGVKITPTRETQDNKAFQNGTVVNTAQTSFKETISFEMLEYTVLTASVYNGNSAAVNATETASTMSGALFSHYSWIIDMTDGGVKKTRYYFPDAKVTEQGEEAWVNGEQAFMGVVLTAYPDGIGVNHYKWTDLDITVSA